MALRRYVTEMGMGVDVHGGDYTKAAKRAVADAIRHSSLNFFEQLNKSRDDLHVIVKLGVQDPSAIDAEAIKHEIPYGAVRIDAELGGLNVSSEDGKDLMVIVNAAVLVCFDE